MNRFTPEEEERLIEGDSPLQREIISEKPQPVDEPVTWKTLPHKRQLLLLALCRLSNPLSNACLLPYVYFLVKSIVSDPEDASKIPRLTGVVVAAYPLGQMSTSMLWGRLSDSYGRKPIILLGMLISVISNLAFGFSRTIGALIFWRIFAGMANGNMGVMRGMTAEIVKQKKHQTRAYLAVPLIFNSGRVSALAIGGCLADPVKNVPSLFGPSGLFNVSKNPNGVAWAIKYPYSLPALFNGITLSIVLFLAIFGLKESLEAKEHDRDFGILLRKTIAGFVKHSIFRKPTSGYTTVEMEESEVMMSDLPSPAEAQPLTQRARRRPPFSKIWTWHILKTLFAFSLLPLHNSTFLHVFPVFLSMPESPNTHFDILRFTGGLGLASPSIGIYLATFGVCGILLQLFIFPHIQKRVGTLGCFRLAHVFMPISYLFAPYLALLSSHKVARWPAMAAVLLLQIMGRTMAFPSSVLLLTETAPQKNVLGTIHGAGNTVSALASAGGPVIGGLLLAYGTDIGAIGVVWWAWLCSIALVALAWSTLKMKNGHKEEGMAERNVGEAE